MIRILYVNLWAAPTGTIVASSSASALPAAATQHFDRTYVWRSGNEFDGQTLTRDLGSAQAVTSVALANVRLMNAGAVTLYQAGSGASPGAWTLVATLPTQDVDSRVTYAFFATVTARHWRLQWANGIPAVAAVAEAGYIHLGGYYEPPAENIEPPISIDPMDPSVGRSSVDGQQSFVRRTGFAAGALRFVLTDDAGLDSLRAVYRAIGRRAPAFVVLSTDVLWQAWLLRITSSLGIQYLSGEHHATFSWEEVR